MLTKTTARLSLLIPVCLFLFTPKTAAQWQRITPPGTADIQGIVQHNGYLFAGGTDIYFYRSADAGKTWQAYTAGADSTSGVPYFPNLRQFAAHGNTLYALGKFRIFKTNDNGQTWQHILKYQGFPEPDWQPGSQFAATDTSFLLVTQGRVIRYRFSTSTWEDAFLPQTGDGSCLVLSQRAGNLRLGTNSGRFYTSIDGGNTWALHGNGPNSIQAAVFIGDTIVSISQHLVNASKVNRSFDDGQTWDTRIVPTRLYHPVIKFFQGKLYSMPQSDSTKVLFSSDLGETWTTFFKAVTVPALSDLTVLADGTVLAAEKAGILKTDDNGQHWQYSNVGLSQGYTLEGRDGLMWTTASGLNHFTTDGGLHWQSPFITANISYSPNNNPIYARAFGDICRYQGKWYATAPLGITPPQGWGLHISDGDLTQWTFQRCASNSTTAERLFAAGNYLLTYQPNNCWYKYSKDNGLLFYPNTATNHGTCQALTEHKNRFFGLDGSLGKVLTIDTLELDDEFQNFKWDTLGNGLPPAAFTNFAVSEKRLAVFSLQKIAVSDDAGQHWQHITGNLPLSGAGIKSVAVAGDTLLAIVDQRILMSLGSSGAWTDITGNFPGMPTRAVSDGANFVVVGEQSGLYRIDLNNLQAIHLQGLVFQDENGNDLRDPGESGLAGALVQVGQTGFLTTDAAGQFGYHTFFSDSLRVVLPTPYGSVAPQVWYLPMQANVSQEFAVQFPNKVHDLAFTLTRATDYRPGFENKLVATVRNRGTVATSGEVRVFVPKQVEFLGADPTPATNLGDTVLVWQTGDLPLLSSWQAEIRVKAKTTTALGTVVQDTGFVKLVEKDTFPSDNFFSEKSIVIGSFDPNDKLVSPAVLPSALLPERPPMTYTIRFQNTGTASAIHVRILDTLAINFDASALQVLAASHPMTWRLNGRVLEFFFENIQLPDSTSDEPGSHGFVQFSLRPGRLVAPNEVLRNRAAIYFDFNAPVITDFAELPVPKSLTVQETFLTLCPNQASYEGIFYPTVGTVTKILPGQWVDTQRVVHVNWYPLIPTTRLEAEVCPGDTLYGHVWQMPGNDVIYRTETAANGCDSLIEYLVKINWDFHVVWNQPLKPGESLWGIPCYSDTVLIFPGTTQKGCDSTVTVYVTMIVPTQSIEQELFNASLSPNPAGDQAQLFFESPEAKVLDVWLESAEGRTVRHFAEHRQFPAGKNHLPLHLDGLPPGIWTVVIQGGAERRALRLALVKT